MNARFLGHAILFLFFIFFVQPVSAMDEKSTKELLDSQCSICHKFAGKPESKFHLWEAMAVVPCDGPGAQETMR